jgi:hypothetical protein
MVIFVFDAQHANNIPTHSPEHGDHHRAAKHSVRTKSKRRERERPKPNEAKRDEILQYDVILAPATDTRPNST